MKALKKLAITMALTLSGTAFSQEITVFAAASMTNVLQDIQQDFEKAYPQDKITFSFASSSVLAKQIEQDAPADIFISADQKWMDYVAEKQPEKVKHRRNLVRNELVLIAPTESNIEPKAIQAVDFAKELANSYLSVGDPNHVPAGKYAKKALSHYQLWESVEPRLARAKNVRMPSLLSSEANPHLGLSIPPMLKCRIKSKWLPFSHRKATAKLFTLLRQSVKKPLPPHF